MIAIAAPLTCQECGGEVTFLAAGTNDRSSASCMVACRCGAEYLIRVRMDLKTTGPAPEHWRTRQKRLATQGATP